MGSLIWFINSGEFGKIENVVFMKSDEVLNFEYSD
jgi:hypothetical protein